MARKTPARYKSGPKKGQFKPKGARKNPSKKRRSTKRGMTRTTARRAYMPKANKPKRRKARRNNGASGKVLTSVIMWASLTALGKGYVSDVLSKATGSPMAANYGTIAAVGALGFWLTKKAKTQPAGYAVLGVAFAQIAAEVGKATGLIESGAGFVQRSQVMKRLPTRVSIPSYNPVKRIVVPA